MSLFDEMQEEVAKRNVLQRKRAQIKALRKKAKEAFDAQFLLGSSNEITVARLEGRIQAFDECLQILTDERDRAPKHKKRDDN